MAQAEATHDPDAPAELPGRNERLGIMVALACLAIFLSQRPAPSPVDPTTVATEGLDAAGAQLAATSPEAAPAAIEAPPVAADPAAALASTETTAPAASAATEPADPAAPTEAGSAPEATPDVSAPADSASAPAESSDAEAPSSDDDAVDLGGLFSDTFAEENASWTAMTGTWGVSDGSLVQSNPEGYDYINQLDLEVPAEYSVAVRMEAVSESLGGGIIVGQPNLGSRKGAYIIDFTAEGTFLRWGRYDPESGGYAYIGGLNVGTNGTGPHLLTVEALTDTTLVYLDDVYIGAFDAVDPGYVGLITSQSAVAFDDFVLEELS